MTEAITHLDYKTITLISNVLNIAFGITDSRGVKLIRPLRKLRDASDVMQCQRRDLNA